MKLIVAGSRHFKLSVCYEQIHLALQKFGLTNRITEVIEGGCHTGVDKAAQKYFTATGYEVKTIYADWSLGKSAGPIRNREMAEYGDELLLIWNGTSRGSASMRKCMESLNKPIHEVVLKGYPRQSPERAREWCKRYEQG